jgi:hypothetical protein
MSIDTKVLQKPKDKFSQAVSQRTEKGGKLNMAQFPMSNLSPKQNRYPFGFSVTTNAIETIPRA